MRARPVRFLLLPSAAVRIWPALMMMNFGCTKFADLDDLQITDDILDVEGTEEELGKPVGSDAKNHKSTYVTLYGLQAAHELAEKTVAEALECLEMFGENAEPLREITRLMTDRKK